MSLSLFEVPLFRLRLEVWSLFHEQKLYFRSVDGK